MFSPRIIPVLLLRNKGLVKSVKFKDHRYIGDPINAVKIYNDLLADELVFLDIDATRQGRTIPLDIIEQVGEEANMPFAVGGGIRTVQQIRDCLKAGAEKVIINSEAFTNPNFIREAADAFGSSTIVVCMDVKKSWLGGEQVMIEGGRTKIKKDPVACAREIAENCAGELIIQSIDHDGVMQGFDLALTEKIASAVTIPVVALGGAGSVQHMQEVYKVPGVSAMAAGSMFVYHGPRKAVLINYIEKSEIFHK